MNRLAKSKEVQLRADLWEVDTNLKVVQAPAVQDERLKGFKCLQITIAIETIIFRVKKRFEFEISIIF